MDEQHLQAVRNTNRFMSVIFQNDLLSVLLKGHLTIEANINDRLTEAFPNPKVLRIERMSFSAKLDLCTAMMIFGEGVIDACTVLNRFRNDFFHKLDASLSDEQINDFVGRLPIDKTEKDMLRDGTFKLLDKLRFAIMYLYAMTGSVWDNSTMADLFKRALEQAGRLPEIPLDTPD